MDLELRGGTGTRKKEVRAVRAGRRGRKGWAVHLGPGHLGLRVRKLQRCHNVMAVAGKKELWVF